MTIDLDRMEELLKAATPGPWKPLKQPELTTGWAVDLETFTEFYISEGSIEPDALFIAAARTFIPEAIARIRELETELKSLEEHEFGRRPEQFPSD